MNNKLFSDLYRLAECRSTFDSFDPSIVCTVEGTIASSKMIQGLVNLMFQGLRSPHFSGS